MWDFLERLTRLALPRIRDFRGVPSRSFDGRGNYSLGLREQLAFPEIDYDKIDRLRGLEVSIVTTAKTDEESKRLLAAPRHALRRLTAQEEAETMAKKSLIAKQQRKPRVPGRAATTAAASAAARAATCAASRMCRICFRERALLGELPGVTKSSW